MLFFKLPSFKKYLLVLILMSLSCISYAQSYMGYTLYNSLLKATPSIKGTNVHKVPVSSNIFLISLYNYNGYYHVIDVSSNKEGYIIKTNLKDSFPPMAMRKVRFPRWRALTIPAHS